MDPKISVIIVVFNAIETLKNAIESVLAQNNASFELIIIDGGSSDGTLNIIKKYRDRIAYYISERDKGIYDAMNKAVLHTKGSWIYFLGADDLLFDNNVLQNLTSKLISQNTVYYGDVYFKHSKKIYDGRFNAFKLATRNISHQSIFYSRAVFAKYRFNIIYKIFADYDLNIKLYNDTSFKFRYIPVIVAVFDDSGSSGSNVRDYNFDRNRLAIVKKYFPTFVFLYRFLRTKIANLISGS